MNKTAAQAPIRLAPTTGTTGTACMLEPSGLTQDEIRQIVLDLIG